MQIMAYDFHKGARAPAPVLPEDKIRPIVEYAKQNVNDQDKIVFLMPLYGHVWTLKTRLSRGRRITYYRPVGTLSAASNDRFLRIRGSRSYIDDGELRIDAGTRIVYTQDREVFRRRHKMLEELGIKNYGYWKQEHANSAIIREINRL